MIRFLVDVAGWLGAGALLSAYALVSSGRLRGRAIGFQLLNLAGAVGLLVNGVYHGAWPSAGLNSVWLVVGLTALTRLRRTEGHTGWTAGGQRAPTGSSHRTSPNTATPNTGSSA